MKLQKETFHVLILAGGRGTRSADPKLPKILQEIGDGVDLLRLHFQMLSNSGFTRITLLLGFGAEVVVSRTNQLLSEFPGLCVNFVQDAAPGAGTLLPVLDAVSQTESEKFLLLLGDIAIGADYGALAHSWLQTGKPFAACTHPNLHPLDSDTISQDPENPEKYYFKKKQTSLHSSHGVPRAIAGVFFFTRNFSSTVTRSPADLTETLVTEAMNSNAFSEIVTCDYMKDSGTASRLELVRKDFNSGAIIRRANRLKPGIFLDRDGTLIPDLGTSRKGIFPNEIEGSTAHAIARANSEGIPVFLVTNQPGVAKGEISRADVCEVERQIESALAGYGAILDDFRFCEHHPDSGFSGEIMELKISCGCRKPKAGMLRDLAQSHGIDLSRSFVIGDTENDKGAAAECGAKYLFAIHGEQNSVADQIDESISRCVNVYR